MSGNLSRPISDATATMLRVAPGVDWATAIESVLKRAMSTPQEAAPAAVADPPGEERCPGCLQRCDCCDDPSDLEVES